MKIFLIKTLWCLMVISFCQLSYAAKTPYKIGFLLDKKTEKTTNLLSELQHQISAVVGEDALIIYPNESILVNDYELEQAKKNYNQLIQNDTDIIIAFGTVNNEVISGLNDHKKPTILFGAVNSDLNKLDVTKEKSGINNFTYLIESASYKKDLLKLQELTEFKHVGILVDKQTIDFLPLDSLFTNILNPLKASYKIIPITNVEIISEQLSDVDAVYLAGGFFLEPNEVKELSSMLIDRKLPSFTQNSVNQVENGIMASHFAKGDIDQFFRRVALTVEAYIAGTPLSEMPVFIDSTSQLTINFNIAAAVGVPIKYSLISDTDFVGDFINVKSKKQYDLMSIINQALSKNRGLASSKLSVALKEQNVKSAVSDYLPDISTGVGVTHIDSDTAAFSNGLNPEYSTDGNVKLSQLIFSETVNASVDIQKELQKAEQENYNANELDLIFNVVNTYFTTLILKSNLQIQLQNLKLTKQNLNLAKQNFEAGQSSKSDMLRFQSQKAQNTQALVEARNQLAQSVINLNQLLFNPIDFEIDIVDVSLGDETFKNYNYDVLTSILDDPSLTDPFVDYLIKKAKLNAPELKALAFNINATERDIQRNGARRYLPTISLQAQYNRNFDRSGSGTVAPPGGRLLDDGHNVMLNFSIPLFNQNKFNINQQTAMIQKEQLEVNKQNLELSLARNVNLGVLDLTNQVSNISLSKISEQSAKETLGLTQLSYQAGEVNIVQLIDAQNNLFQTQLSRTNAIYNFIISSLQLERFMGYYFLLNSEEKNKQFRQEFFNYLKINPSQQTTNQG
jgi:outer membrane protein